MLQEHIANQKVDNKHNCWLREERGMRGDIRITREWNKTKQCRVQTSANNVLWPEQYD